MKDSPYNPVKHSRFDSLVEWLKSHEIRYQHLTAVATDAGARRYYRLNIDNSTLIAVDADPQVEDTRAFIDIGQQLTKAGVHTPVIHHYNLEKGFLLVEDLGAIQLQQLTENGGTGYRQLYNTAMDVLAQMQQHASTKDLPEFDQQFIQTELSLFDTWYLDRHLGISLSRSQRAVLQRTYDLLISTCIEQPQAFMHRDFHSRNLMVTANDQLAVIDFQGAMLGPITYDPGSLLKDCYTKPSAQVSAELSERHRSKLYSGIAMDQYRRWYDLTALQRHLKILGIFCRLHYRDQKPQYLQHFPTLNHYVLQTTEAYTDLAEFDDLFRTIIRSIQ